MTGWEDHLQMIYTVSSETLNPTILYSTEHVSMVPVPESGPRCWFIEWTVFKCFLSIVRWCCCQFW